MKNLKIGITLGLRTNDEAIWTNGIKLNCLILARMLQNSKMNYDVHLLNFNDGEFKYDEPYPNYLNGFKFHKFLDKYEEMDLIFVVGSQINEEYLIHFKSLSDDKRVVSYRCGNNYIISAESILFKESESKVYQFERTFDELWYIPQQHETNYGYYSTLYRTNSIIVPFIWDQYALLDNLQEIENFSKEGRFKKGIAYTKKDKKVIGVMEPNLNIVKFCLIPLLICEQSYRGIGKDKIDYVMLTNSEKVGKHKDFLGIVENLDLYKDDKISSESRYRTAFIVTQHMDVVVCHQLLNPLNYLYLDVAYMGYPVLHNAPMCKDIGYYYEGSDTIDGAEKLNWILENHDDNISEYKSRNSEALARYHSSNEDLIKTYDTLIHNLYNGGNKKIDYDPETNLYKDLIKNKKSKKVKK